MKNLSMLCLTLLFGVSCQKQTKTLDFKTFTIEVPKTWTTIKQKGIDSYVGMIAIDNVDTLFFDLGWYSNSLEEDKPYEIEGDSVLLINKEKSTTRYAYYDYYGLKDTTNFEKFLKNKVGYEKIDHKNAKIVRPKKSGNGTTGIYIDSLWMAGAEADSFQLNGHNLKPENEKLLLIAIKTIKFFPKNRFYK